MKAPARFDNQETDAFADLIDLSGDALLLIAGPAQEGAQVNRRNRWRIF